MSNETVAQDVYHYVIDDAESDTEYNVTLFAVSTGFEAKWVWAMGSVYTKNCSHA